MQLDDEGQVWKSRRDAQRIGTILWPLDDIEGRFTMALTEYRWICSLNVSRLLGSECTVRPVPRIVIDDEARS